MAIEATELIAQLQQCIERGGDREVYFADGYDHALEVTCVEDAEDMAWEGEPEGPYIALS
jgi:hypothetical protein